jgi:hypothetical protein
MSCRHAFYRSRQLVLAILMLSSLPGCMKWNAQNVAPVEALKTPVPERLRVHLNGDRTVFLYGAQIQGDSLVGVERGKEAPGRPIGRTAFALTDVAATEGQGANVVANMAIVGGVVALGAFIALAAAYGSAY